MYWNKLGVLVVLLMLLTACGNKGPLVMPDAVKSSDNNVAEKVKETEQELTN